MAKYASKVVEQAKAWLGYNETDGVVGKKNLEQTAERLTLKGTGKRTGSPSFCSTFFMSPNGARQKVLQYIKKI